MSHVVMACVVLILLSVVPVVQGAEFEVHPSMAVSEEYTDNFFETSTNRISEYITRVQPGLAARYKAPALDGELAYVFDYRYYARKKREDEITHILTAKGHLTAVENFMYLDVSDEYQRVSLDVTRDVTRESLFFNQSDQNVAAVSPYVTFHPIERLAVKSGYRFIDTRYFSSSAIDKIDHIAFLDMAFEITKHWSLTADYTFTRELAVIDNFKRHQALGGLRYEYGDKSFVFAQAGKSWITYDSGPSLNSFLWNAGIAHVFDTVTATIATGVRYVEDPLSNVVKESFVSCALEKRFQRGNVSLSPQYSEYVLANSGTLQTKKYSVTARGQYELTSNVKSTLSFTAEKYEQPFLGSYTRHFQVDSGLSYPLAEQMTASLTYIYADYYSPGIAVDNRHVNRGIIEIKKIF